MIGVHEVALHVADSLNSETTALARGNEAPPPLDECETVYAAKGDFCEHSAPLQSRALKAAEPADLTADGRRSGSCVVALVARL